MNRGESRKVIEVVEGSRLAIRYESIVKTGINKQQQWHYSYYTSSLSSIARLFVCFGEQ